MSCWRIETAVSPPAGNLAPVQRSGVPASSMRPSSSVRALDDIARADEAGDEFRARPVVDVLGRAGLLDPAAVHHRDEVGGGHRLRLVVGHVDRRVAVFVVQAAHLEAHLLAQIGVEIGQRLVEQQRLRLDDQRARQRDALLLAARQLAGIAVGERLEPRGGEDRARACGAIVVAIELAQLAGRRRRSPPPSCAATARSSGRSSTCCAARAAACGAGEETTRSPTRISPADGSMKPAISRSVVVLPQPDGPSRQTSSPCSMRSDTSSTTAIVAVMLGQAAQLDRCHAFPRSFHPPSGGATP